MDKIIRYRHEYSNLAGTPYPWRIKNFIKYESFGYNGPYRINDMGIGDRVGCWQQVYYITRLLKWKYRIQSLASQFLESFFFKFPNTEFITEDEFYSNIDDYKCLTDDEYYRLCKGAYKPDYPFIVTNYRSVSGSNYGKDPIELITLQHPNMEDDMRRLFSSYISVHVRRFHGICFDDDDLIELSSELREQYKKEARYNSSWSWKYIKDISYFNYMNKQDPNCKFYVATDLPEKYYLEKWKNVFPNRIVTMNNIFSKFYNIIEHYYGKTVAKQNYELIYQMTDFFAMAYSKQIISCAHKNGTGPSSFAVTAHKIGKTRLTCSIVS